MRKPEWRSLIGALVLAPLVAGITGGVLIWLGLSTRIIQEHGLESGVFVALAGALPAAAVGSMWAYIFGSPVILGTWLVAHLFRLRSQFVMATVLGLVIMAVTVAAFRSGILNYAGFDGEAAWVLFVIVPGGFASGFLTGFLISRMGYRNNAQPAGPAA
jgi:hypothetical protein